MIKSTHVSTSILWFLWFWLLSNKKKWRWYPRGSVLIQVIHNLERISNIDKLVEMCPDCWHCYVLINKYEINGLVLVSMKNIPGSGKFEKKKLIKFKVILTNIGKPNYLSDPIWKIFLDPRMTICSTLNHCSNNTWQSIYPKNHHYRKCVTHNT